MNEDIQAANNHPEDGQPEVKPAAIKPKIVLSRNEATVYLLSAGILAIIYAICFSSSRTMPLLSLAVFCPIALLTLTITLKQLGMFKNKRAFIWVIPIVIISLFNFIFSENLFTYSNVIMMFILFAAFTFSAMQEQRSIFDTPVFLGVMTGNWLVPVLAVRSILPGKNNGRKSSAFMKVLIGIVISVPVLMFIVVLLISADPVFSDLIGNLFSSVFNNNLINFSFISSFIISWLYFAGYIYRGKKVTTDCKSFTPPSIKSDIIICATFLTLINLVFLLFSYVQVAYLFNGGFMSLPEGMVYSQYAREGFFQLLFVTVINFSVLMIFMSVFNTTRHSKVLKYLLLSLCLFTCVLIASSFYRMFLYIDVYGYTTLRLWVITFLTMEIFLMIITLIKLFNPDAAFIKRFVITGLIFYMIVNVAGSDYVATRLNVDMFLAGKLNNVYITDRSQDTIYVARPLLDDDEYIHIDFRIYRKAEVDAKTISSLSEKNPPLTGVFPDKWQNMTLFAVLNNN